MAAKECCCYITPFRAMTYPFFNQKFDSGMYEVLSWFGINLMVSFHVFIFCNLTDISHPADLDIFYINLELAIELY